MPGWVERGDTEFYYRRSSEKATFDEAKTVCEQDNGKLATISSQEEQDFLIALLPG